MLNLKCAYAQGKGERSEKEGGGGLGKEICYMDISRERNESSREKKKNGIDIKYLMLKIFN